jgi:hypothetical protein
MPNLKSLQVDDEESNVKPAGDEVDVEQAGNEGHVKPTGDDADEKEKERTSREISATQAFHEDDELIMNLQTSGQLVCTIQ